MPLDDLRSDVTNLLHSQLSDLLALDESTSRFAEQHLNQESVTSQIVDIALKKIPLTAAEGCGHGGGFYDDAAKPPNALLFVQVSTVPASPEQAASYFTVYHAGYPALLIRYFEARNRELLHFRVMFHMIVFVVCEVARAGRRGFRLSATCGLYPIELPGITPVWPKDCLCAEDQNRLVKMWSSG